MIVKLGGERFRGISREAPGNNRRSQRSDQIESSCPPGNVSSRTNPPRPHRSSVAPLGALGNMLNDMTDAEVLASGTLLYLAR